MGKLTSDIKLVSRMATAIFLTLLRRRQTRRKMMFAVSVVAMLLAFAGFTILDGLLMADPLLFVIYWFFCAGLVILMMLLAAYDVAALKGNANARSDREVVEMVKEIEAQARSSAAENEER